MEKTKANMIIVRRKYKKTDVSGTQKTEKDNPATRISKTISLILHPFAVPVYATAALMAYDPVMSLMPLRIKLLFLIIIVIVAFAIPALSFFLLRTINLTPGKNPEKHDDRAMRLVVVAVSYGICIAMLGNIMWGTVFHLLLVTAFFCAAIALAVNFIAPISLHMIAVGAMTALFVLFAIAGNANIFIPLAISILLSGILASARLYLGRHNPTEITAGYALGFAVCVAVMFFTG